MSADHSDGHMTEPFTAVAACPRCSNVAVHQFRMPRTRPAGYEPGVTKKIVKRDGSVTKIAAWGRPDRYAEEEAATVMRQCGLCGHEWAQA